MKRQSTIKPIKTTGRNNAKSAAKRRMVDAEKRATQAYAMTEALQRKLNQVFALRELSAEAGVLHEKCEQIRVACKSGGLGLKKRILEILSAGTEYSPDELKELPAAGESSADDE